jgi:hypothetical protein
MDRLERENADLRRMIPPPAPAPAPRNPDPEPDWEKELFANPAETLRKHGEMVAKKVSDQLRAEYQRDRGTTQFWDRFYAKHPDLKEDHDLVEVTLNSNLSALANIRVEDAYEKLADLTRERILRYTGKAVRKGPKARAEGSGGSPTSPPPATPPQAEVTSLSDLLRTRRANRRAGAA